MVFWIFAALVVYYIHLFLPSMIRIPQIGISRYVGSRDDLPALPAIGQRAERAHNNLRENMIPFVALALLSLALGEVSATAILGAQLFVLARIVYLLCYLFAVPWLRSIVWSIGFVGLVLMAWPLIG
ncbi:MAPEG family protein [Maritalea porphyrae]|uniref:Membrane protein n=1 Tax=Maritalea porphyrae TaxID=880732 RepID=A0ABQ5UUX0_9HYPH|nr:MAPEG family protein [Maritalea porphyrae]GLQ19038.1 membrane protein [Maritalea porphyrae]